MAKKDDQSETKNTEAVLVLNTAAAEVFPPSIEQQLRDGIKEIAAKLEKAGTNNILVNELEALASLGLEPVNQESVDSTEVK